MLQGLPAVDQVWLEGSRTNGLVLFEDAEVRGEFQAKPHPI